MIHSLYLEYFKVYRLSVFSVWNQLSLFTEISQSQTCGRLIFTLTAHAGNNQYK